MPFEVGVTLLACAVVNIKAVTLVLLFKGKGRGYRRRKIDTFRGSIVVSKSIITKKRGV